MILAVFIIVPAGKAIVVSTFLSPGPVPVAVGLPICRIGTTTRGVIIPSVGILTMVCRIIIRAITADTSMSVSVGIGPVGIAIAGITGMAVIRIIGTGRISLLSRTRM